MPSAAMMFDLIARDHASATFTRVGDSAARAGEKAEVASKRMGHFAAAIGAIALVEAGKKSLQMAGDFQQSTNVLVTAAGETQANLAKVRQGIMDIAVGTGTPLKELTDGMYQVEKAGYRGADGLAVLKTASQGAREEGANLATVTSAMTSIMASYHVPVKDNVAVMNQLKTAAGESKTTMEQFAGSLSAVLPVASANHISFAKVAGALATLTQHGTSADEATQELSNTIRNLAAPNMVAIKEMGQLGISAQDVSQHLGQRGVAGTLTYLSETVLHKMGPSGKVLLDTFYQSQSAGQAVTQMMAKMDPTVRSLAKRYVEGKISVGDWRTALKGLTPQQASLASQFAVAENKARGFNTAIRQGMPGSQTYTEAIKKMTGGANGLNTTLQLTGESTAGTTERIKKISDAAKNAGKDVDGWASTQKLFNVQLGMFKQQVDVLGVKIGTALMPSVLGLVHGLGDMLHFVEQNQSWLVPLAKTAATVAGAIFLVNKATLAWKTSIAALDAVKGVFGGIAGGLNNFVTKADTAGGAVKTWGSRLGGLAGFLGGPWGIAIGLGVTALGLFLAKQTQGLHDTPQFKQDVLDYAGAMDQMAGAVNRGTAALDANVRAQTVKGLQDKGAFDLAEHLGISTKMLTDATLGNKDAIALVNGVVAQNLRLNPQLSKANSDRVKWATALSNQINAQAQAELEQIRQENQRKAAMDTSTDASRAAALATKVQRTAVSALTGSLKTNGATLADNTAKGRANRSAVVEAIKAVNAKASADFASTLKTKGLSAALRVASADLQHGKSDIMNAAKAAHANTGEVNGMIRQYQKTPKRIQTDVKTRGVPGTLADIHHVQSAMGGLNNKKVFIQFDTNAYKIGQTKFAVNLTAPHGRMADGGPVPGWSPHPRADNIPIMATAGEFMVNQRAAKKHRGLLEAINSGAQGYADGGVVSRSLTVDSGRVPAAAAEFPHAAAWFAQAFAKAAGSMLGDALAKGLQGLGGNYGPALSFAKSQAGKPYIWAAAGPGGYDCSGFMGAIENVILGQSPYHRRWSTGNFRGQHSFDHFTKDAHSPFMIGVTNAGVGHTAGTLNGVNVESRGGQGVVVGRAARGWNDPLFPMHYGFTGTPVGGRGGNGGQSASGIRGLAQSMLRARGWGDEYPSLNYVISHESGWDPHARNSSSGAYGLGQALPASKMAGYGPDYRNNAHTQLAWMLSYIGNRYGDPRGAESFWRGHHWYDRGGYLKPGLTVAYNGTGQRERVLSAPETRRYERLERHGGSGGGTTIVINVDAPRFVGSNKDLAAEIFKLAQTGELKKSIRKAGVQT